MAPTLALAAALLLAPAAVGCSSDGPDGPSATVATTPTTEAGTTTEPEATTTTAAPTVEEQVEAAYLEAMGALFEAAVEPDPDNATLLATQTGPSLEKAQSILADFKSRGIHIEFPGGEPPVVSVASVELAEGATAILRACTVDDSQQVDSEGLVVDDDVVSRLTEAEMRLKGGTWSLYTQRDLKVWEDGAGCAR